MNDKTLVTGNAADSAELDTTVFFLVQAKAKDGTGMLKMSWTPVKSAVKVKNDAVGILNVMAAKGDLIHEEFVYAPEWEALAAWKVKNKVAGFGLGIPATMVLEYLTKSKSPLAIVPRNQRQRDNHPQFRLGVITETKAAAGAPSGYDDLIVAE